MGLLDKIKEESGYNKLSDNVEHITGFTPVDIGAAFYSGGSTTLPGAFRSLSMNSIQDFISGGGGGNKDFITGGAGTENIESIKNGITSGEIDPEKLAHAYGYTESGEIEEFMKDPTGAIAAAEKAARLLEESNQSALGQMEFQRNQLEELFAPYYDAAVNEGLPQLQNMIMGGDVDYTPSKTYEYQKETGTRNIKRIQGAKGQLNSSATEGKLAGFYSDLAAEEAERAYGGAMSQVQLGSGATNAVAGATQTISGNVDSLYARMGQTQQNAINTAAGSRQSLYAGLANTMQGLAGYIEQEG